MAKNKVALFSEHGVFIIVIITIRHRKDTLINAQTAACKS